MEELKRIHPTLRLRASQNVFFEQWEKMSMVERLAAVKAELPEDMEAALEQIHQAENQGIDALREELSKCPVSGKEGGSANCPYTAALKGGSTATETEPSYTAEDIARHDSREDCWIAHEGVVYDVTKWIPNHPGKDSLLRWAGQDASKLGFKLGPQHPDTVPDMLAKHRVGIVKAPCPWTQMMSGGSDQTSGEKPDCRQQ